MRAARGTVRNRKRAGLAGRGRRREGDLNNAGATGEKLTIPNACVVENLEIAGTALSGSAYRSPSHGDG